MLVVLANHDMRGYSDASFGACGRDDLQDHAQYSRTVRHSAQEQLMEPTFLLESWHSHHSVLEISASVALGGKSAHPTGSCVHSRRQHA